MERAAKQAFVQHGTSNVPLANVAKLYNNLSDIFSLYSEVSMIGENIWPVIFHDNYSTYEEGIENSYSLTNGTKKESKGTNGVVNGEGPSTSDADYDASSDPDFYDPFYDDDSEEVLEENRKRIEKLIQEVSRKDGRQMVARLSKRFSSLKLSIENVQYCAEDGAVKEALGSVHFFIVSKVDKFVTNDANEEAGMQTNQDVPEFDVSFNQDQEHMLKYYVGSHDFHNDGTNCYLQAREFEDTPSLPIPANATEVFGVLVANVHAGDNRWLYYVTTFLLHEMDPNFCLVELTKINSFNTRMSFEHKWLKMTSEDIMQVVSRLPSNTFSCYDSMASLRCRLYAKLKFEFGSSHANGEQTTALMRGLDQVLPPKSVGEPSEPKVLYMLPLARNLWMSTFDCIFCNYSPTDADKLRDHLFTFHDRFRYDVVPKTSDSPMIVSVEVWTRFRHHLDTLETNDIANWKLRSEQLKDYSLIKYPIDFEIYSPRIECTHRQLLKSYGTEAKVCEFLRKTQKNVTVTDSWAITKYDLPLLVRNKRAVFYHSHSGLPKLVDDLEYDSEDEIFPNWVSPRLHSMLTDCVDLSNDEIALMMWWSRFMMADNNPRKYFTPSHMPNALRDFVDKFGESIVELNLRRNFVLHMMTTLEAKGLNDYTVIVELGAKLAMIENNMRQKHKMRRQQPQKEQEEMEQEEEEVSEYEEREKRKILQYLHGPMNNKRFISGELSGDEDSDLGEVADDNDTTITTGDESDDRDSEDDDYEVTMNGEDGEDLEEE